MQYLLNPSEIRRVCNPDIFTDLAGRDKENNIIIGQERAIKALKLGLGMKAPGFNLFVSGEVGTGKLTAVTGFVERQAKNEPVPPDWCYVNNFKDTYRPDKMSLPPGNATRFKKDMKALIRDIFNALVKAFESEAYAGRKEKIINSFVDEQNRILAYINDLAEKESFTLKQTSTSIITLPVRDGKTLTEKELNNLSPAELAEINDSQNKLQDQIGASLREIRKYEKNTDEDLEQLAKEVAQEAIGSLIEELNVYYKPMPQVTGYLRALKEDIMENLPDFMKSQKGNQERGDNSFLKRYEVTVLVDNTDTKGAPVITERNPSYNNLLGRVDKESFMGTLVTDFTMIRKGALHSANGGYLIIRVEELLQNVFAWECLKRALKNKEVVIEEAADQLGYLTTRTLKPEAVPLNIKVILIGSPMLYQLLYQYDGDFRELFKIKADFDSLMPRTDATSREQAGFIASLCNRESLLPASPGAIGSVLEYSSRLAEHQDKLSTRFGAIADLVREAGYYAQAEQATEITGGHISRAFEEKLYRSNLVQEKINEMITTRQLFIDITGAKTGQINGLSVIDMGDIAFGMPARITCTVSPGRGGVIAIEREAEMSGPIHTKGVLILTGYLAGTFMHDKPLSLSARLVFEQSYSGVEGDSASSTELYALLSALSELSLKQGIAVTGSVNQKGEIQPIGGVNEKIEGYFEICKQMGFNGEQGVMIPSANLKNLMLKEEVVAAVTAGTFRIWTVDSIADGIELLTGVKAGSLDEAESVFGKVNATLKRFAANMKDTDAEEVKQTGGGKP